MPETPTSANRPRYARAVDLFGGRAFDVKSAREFASAAAEYAALSVGERDYDRDHFLFRQAQALEAIDAKLGRLLDQGDRDGRMLAVGFRGVLEALEEIAGDGGGEDDEPDPAGEAAGDDDVDELADDEPVEPDEVWIGPDGEPDGGVEREHVVIDAEAEVVEPDADDPDDVLRDAVEGPADDDSEAA